MRASTEFYVDKISYTFADSLVAFGFSRVLRELMNRQGLAAGDVTIIDQGAYYTLACQPALESLGMTDFHRPINPIPFIRTAKNVDKLPKSAEVLDYELERNLTGQYYEARSKSVPAKDLPPKSQHWDILRAINPVALPGYNGLLLSFWQTLEQQAEVMALLLDLFGRTPNNIDGCIDVWNSLDKAHGWGIKPTATSQQLYNPDQGKGQNRVKSDGLSISNQNNFWLIEWLKAVGFYEAAMTRLVLGGKDRKTIVVAPREISIEVNRKVMSAARPSALLR